jgi:hypothetical protein
MAGTPKAAKPAPAKRATKAAKATETTTSTRPAKRASPPAKAPPRAAAAAPRVVVERVQTGFRMEKRLLKVLKAVAEYHDMALGDLVEGIVLHAFDGRAAFGSDSLKRIADFKRLYGLELDSSHAHKLVEKS